jgi:hypothetical protein
MWAVVFIFKGINLKSQFVVNYSSYQEWFVAT